MTLGQAVGDYGKNSIFTVTTAAAPDGNPVSGSGEQDLVLKYLMKYRKPSYFRYNTLLRDIFYGTLVCLLTSNRLEQLIYNKWYNCRTCWKQQESQWGKSLKVLDNSETG